MDLKKFRQECLESHNNLRAKHGVGPVTLNDDLCKFAQEWADKLAKKDQMQHRQGEERKFKGQTCGENLYGGSKKDPTGDEVVKYWYSEIKDHDFKNPDWQKSGHFSQVVWKGSNELGIGVGASSKFVFVVANYLPAGNMLGKFQENVFPPK